MQDEHNENPDTTRRSFWVTMNSLVGYMGSDKGLGPWVLACDDEVDRIKESIVAKRTILSGKMKHTKLSKRKKSIKLVDLDSRKFRWSLRDKICKSPVTEAQRKAIRITSSQTRQLSN